MPPSISTSTWPPTAATTSGSARNEGADAVELASAMIRDHHRGSARIHGTTSVVAGKQALDHDRAGPVLANPAQIVPGHSRAGQRSRNINQLHRSLSLG